VIYAFLIYLGAAYSQELAIVPVESRLAYIAQKTLGHIAGPMVATAVGLACITTAIVLTSVVSDYYQKVLFRSKISKGATNVLILTITFFISTLKFNGIAQYLSPILTFLYPGIIMMTLLSLGQKLFNWPYPRWMIVAVFVLTFLRMVLN
jgi:LIVCS family branched-chain amino acid:cation transporter